MTEDKERGATWFDADRECHCRIDEPIPDQESTFDDSDRTVMANIVKFGWHVVLIPDEPRGSGWVFSVGMWHTLGSPELAVFGMDRSDAHAVINDIGASIRAGRRIGPDVVVDDMLAENRKIAFRPAHSSWYGPMFGYATWFGRRPPLPIVQVVWADPQGRFPWDDGIDDEYRFGQPSLWIPADDHPQGRWSGTLIKGSWDFPVAPDTTGFTTKRIAFDGLPVLYVVHGPDGEWQFLDRLVVREEDAALVHLAHVVGANPGVEALADLPRGWEAFRETESDAWTRRPMNKGPSG
jgi:hypothetical protein